MEKPSLNSETPSGDLDLMNDTLKRMHKMPPKQHKAPVDPNASHKKRGRPAKTKDA